MDEFLKAVLIQIGAYLTLVLAVLFILNFASSGFITKWARTKSSRGALILVRIRTVLQDSFALGKVQDGFLIFTIKDKSEKNFIGMPAKKEKRISLEEGMVYRSAGIQMVDVDDAKNCVVSRDFSKVPGFDAEKFNNLYLRALYKPSLIDDKTKIIIIMLVVVIIAVALVGFLNYNANKELTELVMSMRQVPVESITPVTGGA